MDGHSDHQKMEGDKMGFIFTDDSKPSPHSGNDFHNGGLHAGNTETFLLPALHTDSVGTFIFACILLMLAAFGMEVLRHFVSKFERNIHEHHEEKVNLVTTFENYPAINVDINKDDRKSQVTPEIPSSTDEPEMIMKTSCFRALKSWIMLGVLYSCSYLISILLMLIAMTYNIYLILSLCVGVTAGKMFVLHLKYRIR